MEQTARNLTDALDGFFIGKRHLIHDRDPLFTTGFRDILESAGVKTVRLPPRSPNLNPHAERFVLSSKSECLIRLILFSEAQLRRAWGELVAHDHIERPHQGLENHLIDDTAAAANDDAPVTCRERLGGLLKDYHPKGGVMARRSNIGIGRGLVHSRASPTGRGRRPGS